MEEKFKDYIVSLDKYDTDMIDKRVAEKGIEVYLSQQLVYLDCSRLYKDGSRAMQTIGYPYQREISSYIYALNKVIWLDGYQDVHKKEWTDKLIKRHEANIEYEKENPPIWYGGKKAKDKWNKEHNKLPHRKKLSESNIPGFGKELSNTERLKRLSANFGKLNFTIKTFNKNG